MCQNVRYNCRTRKAHLLQRKEKFITSRVPERQIGELVNSYCDGNKEFFGTLLQANKLHAINREYFWSNLHSGRMSVLLAVTTRYEEKCQTVITRCV
jgi:hypothetical protein